RKGHALDKIVHFRTPSNKKRRRLTGRPSIDLLVNYTIKSTLCNIFYNESVAFSITSLSGRKSVDKSSTDLRVLRRLRRSATVRSRYLACRAHPLRPARGPGP